MEELHVCKHCGNIFEREKKRTGPRPSTCDGCNPRRRFSKYSQPGIQKIYNARWRAKQKAIKAIYREMEEGANG